MVTHELMSTNYLLHFDSSVCTSLSIGTLGSDSMVWKVYIITIYYYTVLH